MQVSSWSVPITTSAIYFDVICCQFWINYCSLRCSQPSWTVRCACCLLYWITHAGWHRVGPLLKDLFFGHLLFEHTLGFVRVRHQSCSPSVWKSSLKTAKRLQPDWTKTGKDRTSSLVFWFLRIKDCKKTGLHGPVFVVQTSLNWWIRTPSLPLQNEPKNTQNGQDSVEKPYNVD
jgi:hypothetical protein